MLHKIHYDSIHEFQDFLSNDEHDYLLNKINNYSEEDWWDKDFEEMSPNWYGRNIWSTEDVVLQNAHQRMLDLFKSYDYATPFAALSRYRPGESMGEHEDEIGVKTIQYGAVLYVNDDYVGGEICYPSFNFCIKPKARSLVLHPGNLTHSVKAVLDGPIRYMSTSFVHGSDEKPAILK